MTCILAAWRWLTFGALMLALATGISGDATAQKQGARATLPVLALHDLAGVPASTDRFLGKVLVLNVWATWCAPCRKELPSLQRLHQRLDPARYAVVGLTLDHDPLRAREYLDERRIAFPNFIGRDRAEVLATLDIRSIPATFIVASDGTVLSRVSGPREWDAPDVISALEAAHSQRELRMPPPATKPRSFTFASAIRLDAARLPR